MKILIIRLSSIGDIILSSFVVRLTRKLHPDAQIDFLVAKEYKSLLEFNPYIDRVICYDKSKPFWKHLKETLSLYNQMYYDVIVDLQNNFRSKIFTLGKYGAIYRFHKRRFYKFKLVFLKTRTVHFEPIPILYRNTYPPLKEFDDGLGLELWTAKDRDGYLPHSRVHNLKSISRIAIAPGAKHFTKKYPETKFAELIETLLAKFNSQIYLIGGTDDIPTANFLTQKFPNIQNFVGKLDILETAELLDGVDLVISNDSSAVHIASARNVPVIQIFGSTVPELGFVPFRVPYQIVEKNEVKCRPCTHYGKSACPKGHFDCMNKITTSDFLVAIEKLIQACS